jgi:phosphoserine phosphatase
MPSVSKKQHNLMAAVAHSPSFAKKVGIPASVGKDFMAADKGKKFKEGKTMKHSDMKQDMPMMKATAEKAVKGHEKRMHKMAKGGVTRADGCVSKGHTKGKMIKMKSGGMC